MGIDEKIKGFSTAKDRTEKEKTGETLVRQGFADIGKCRKRGCGQGKNIEKGHKT